jgi:hypothetical protein
VHQPLRARRGGLAPRRMRTRRPTCSAGSFPWSILPVLPGYPDRIGKSLEIGPGSGAARRSTTGCCRSRSAPSRLESSFKIELRRPHTRHQDEPRRRLELMSDTSAFTNLRRPHGWSATPGGCRLDREPALWRSSDRRMIHPPPPRPELAPQLTVLSSTRLCSALRGDATRHPGLARGRSPRSDEAPPAASVIIPNAHGPGTP